MAQEIDTINMRQISKVAKNDLVKGIYDTYQKGKQVTVTHKSTNQIRTITLGL